MDRNTEYETLLKDLEETPPALEFTLQRVKARVKKRRVGRWCGVPLASLAGGFAAFVLLVNLSTPFALACGSIPALRGLTAAVSFSPSIKTALEHDYAQYVNQTQTQDGVTVTVEFLVVDRKQVHIFYRLEGEQYGELVADPKVKAPDGRPCSWFNGDTDKDTSLGQIVVDFDNTDVPQALTLKLGIRDIQMQDSTPVPAPSSTPWDEPQPPKAMTTFTFQLALDPYYTQQGETVAVNQWIELDGQRIYVSQVEIYPTHVRLTLEDDEQNTAWLKGLDFYLEDEHGNRYEKISNGISASSVSGTPFMESHRLESSFFGDAEHLTVRITSAEWLEKGMEYVPVNLKTGTALGPLPEGVLLGGVVLADDTGGPSDLSGMENYVVTLLGKYLDGNENHLYSISNWRYREPGGVAQSFNQLSSSDIHGKEFIGAHELPEGYFKEFFWISNYPSDVIELGMCFSRRTTFETPVSLQIQ